MTELSERLKPLLTPHCHEDELSTNHLNPELPIRCTAYLTALRHIISPYASALLLSPNHRTSNTIVHHGGF